MPQVTLQSQQFKSYKIELWGLSFGLPSLMISIQLRLSARWKDRKASLDEIRRQVVEVWEAIEPQVLEDLLQTMPQRCRDVIAANGMHTKW
jgi:hypothetical protein